MLHVLFSTLAPISHDFRKKIVVFCAGLTQRNTTFSQFSIRSSRSDYFNVLSSEENSMDSSATAMWTPLRGYGDTESWKTGLRFSMFFFFSLKGNVPMSLRKLRAIT